MACYELLPIARVCIAARKRGGDDGRREEALGVSAGAAGAYSSRPPWRDCLGTAVAGAPPSSPPAAAEEESGSAATPRRAGGCAGSATTGSRGGIAAEAAAARASAAACGRPCCRVPGAALGGSRRQRRVRPRVPLPLPVETTGGGGGLSWCGREFRCLRRTAGGGGGLSGFCMVLNQSNRTPFPPRTGSTRKPPNRLKRH
ncbi:unnamed protein product [Urochloa humidicola]